MTPTASELRRLRRFATKVNKALPDLRAAYPTERALLDRVVARARELHVRAGQPLSFALVGEFSAGKSLLLSVLLDAPDLLPASPVPTTGNVTAVRLRPGVPDGRRPQLAHVGFLSAESVGRMVGHLLDGIRGLVRGQGLDYPVALLEGAAPTPAGWARVDAFGRAVWEVRGANADLRLRLLELTRIRDALAAGAALLPAHDGPMAGVPASAVAQAVTIGDRRRLPDRYPEAASAFPLPATTTLDGDVLAAMQPLIRRVGFDVAVDPDEWPFGDLLADPGVELIDMPGLHSAGGSRDEYLALRELERVTGLLMVIDSRRAAGASLLTLDTFLERAREAREQLVNSKLVVANAFDGVPADGCAEHRSVRSMIDNLTGGDLHRAAYASAFAALAHRGTTPPGAGREARRDLEAHRRHWSEVARLDPDRPEAPALAGYAADGGVAAVRDLVARHVREHGLAVQVAELSAVERAVVADLRAARRAGGHPIPPDASDRFEQLAAAATEALDVLHDETDRLAGPDAAVRDGRPLVGAVDDAVLATGGIYAWQQWKQLADRVSDGFVKRLEPAAAAGGGSRPDPFPGDPIDDTWDGAAGDGEAGDGDAWDGDAWDGDAWDRDTFRDDVGGGMIDPGDLEGDQVVTTTAQLADPFADALAATTKAVDALIREWVEEWTAATADRIRPADRETLRLLADSLPDGPKRARRLVALHDLRFVAPDLDEALRAHPWPAPAEVFPLTDGRAFWWHADAPREQTPHQHHVVALRSRGALAEALTRAMHRRVDSVLLDLVRRLRDRHGQITVAVPGHALRRRLAERTGSGSGRADPVDLLLDPDDPDLQGPGGNEGGRR